MRRAVRLKDLSRKTGLTNGLSGDAQFCVYTVLYLITIRRFIRKKAEWAESPVMTSGVFGIFFCGPCVFIRRLRDSEVQLVSDSLTSLIFLIIRTYWNTTETKFILHASLKLVINILPRTRHCPGRAFNRKRFPSRSVVTLLLWTSQMYLETNTSIKRTGYATIWIKGSWLAARITGRITPGGGIVKEVCRKLLKTYNMPKGTICARFLGGRAGRKGTFNV